MITRTNKLQQDSFRHDALLNLLLVILWAQPGFQIDDELFGGLLSLAGMAIFSTLREYETGHYVAVEFSQKNVGDVFDSILHIIDGVQHNNPAHYSSLRTQLISVSSTLSGQ